MGVLLPEQKRKVRKPLLWIGIASIVMTFAGLTSGYVVSRSALMAENRWLQFELPQQFYYATLAIVLSSVTMIIAHRAAKNGSLQLVKVGVLLTLILGVTFAILQYYGAGDLIDRGLYLTGPGSNNATSWVYVIAGLHWLHVVSGIIVLLVTLFQANRNAYTKDDHQGLDMSAIYWHFLDVLWIYLFCFLVFIR